MKFFLYVLCFLCGSVVCFSLDREAFSITKYDLQLQLDPGQHRLGVRGKLTLRNDTAAPQKIAVLQISSSLNWRSIKAGDKAVQFLTQPFTSDIDHTGSLSEAIVTLPGPVQPHATTDLDIAYEGVILLDSTRLTRIGTPEATATSSDWDQITAEFTAVRGVGYVAWYPIATEVANLSEGDSYFQVLQRWKLREAAAAQHVSISVPTDSERPTQVLMNQSSCAAEKIESSSAPNLVSDCTFTSLESVVPTFVVANYGTVQRPSIVVYNLTNHAAAAESYAEAAQNVVPLITDWFGAPREKAVTADLPDPAAAPFESGPFLFTSLSDENPKLAGLAAAHQLTHASFSSPRPWINEGLAHFAQALYLEQQKGRQAALDYMAAHRMRAPDALKSDESKADGPKSEASASNSLVNTVSEDRYRSKAMFVWWMLRDMIGDAALKKALAAYRPEQDKEPSYMPRLISAQTQRDLEWFFDGWVYRDRGLPDFKVESAFSRSTLNKTFILTITVDNAGSAGAEVPLTIIFAGGEVTKRLQVPAQDKATIRVETPAAPREIKVNDGSVPESDTTNNLFKIEPAEK